MLGEIKIVFGKVVDINDEQKICRCRISIDNYTDKLLIDDLPWYFPWYGLSYLPILNDIVPVIIFDENFSTCFYGKKIDLIDNSLGDDYSNYMEIFKRVINDKNVQLTYKTSTGIEFINDKTKVQIEFDKISLFCEINSIVITKDRIDIGNENQEATILGDKGVKALHDIIKHQNNVITEMYNMINAISSACTNPFTLPIKIALTPLIISGQIKLNTENTQVDSEMDKIQSKKVFIE